MQRERERREIERREGSSGVRYRRAIDMERERDMIAEYIELEMS